MFDLHQRLIRHVSYPLLLWRWGDIGILGHLKEFERTQFLPIEDLRSLQLQRLRTVIEHAYRRCPYYRERFDAMGVVPSDIQKLEDLESLPVLTKSDIQKHQERMVATGWPRDDLILNQTGGSTGTPIAFYYGRDRHRSRAAATIRHNAWAGLNVGDRIAYVWGAPRDRPADNWKARAMNALLYRQCYLDTAHITEDKLATFNQTLKRFRPKVIQAYAGSVVLLAQYIKSRGLSAYQPRAIVTSAEVLEPEGRALLRDVFGCPVFNRYGCREFSVVASECEARAGLHTAAEGLYIEVVKDGKAAPAGELGAILVTDLLNLAMPMIRYQIGDMGVWSEGPCSCGRGLPRLESIAGRVTEMLVGGDGRLVSGVFLATYLVAHRPSLGQVQILQEERGRLIYRVRPGDAFNEPAEIQYIEDASRRFLGQDTQIELDLVAEIPHAASGKYLFSRSSVAPEFLQ